MVNGGEFVRFDEDGTDVKLGTFDSDEKRMKVGALVAGICTAPDDACGLDLGGSRLVLGRAWGHARCGVASDTDLGRGRRCTDVTANPTATPTPSA